MLSVSYSDLKSGRIYNFYALHTDETDPVITSANVLYLTQFVSGNDGTAEISYNLLYEEEEPILLAVPATLDMANACVQIPAIEYNGVSQTITPAVTLNGVALTEGTDYMLSGEVSASTAGIHTVEISSIGEYTGFSSVTYVIAESSAEIVLSPGDINGDNKTDAVDAALILKEAAARGSGTETTLTPEQNTAADVNKDGEINAKDASSVLVYAAALGAGKTSLSLEEYLEEDTLETA